MPRVPFRDLPDDARLWIFPVSRALSPDEEEGVLARVDDFLDEWDAHDRPLRAGRDWREGHFLLVAVDESTAPPSGCSIDSLVRILKDEGAALGASFLDHGPVWYRKEGEVCRAERSRFRALAAEGSVGAETRVFDNTVTRLGSVREGEWEKPAARSWHGKAFFGS